MPRRVAVDRSPLYPQRLWNNDALAERDGRPVVATREGRAFWFDAAGQLHLWNAPPHRRKVGQTSVAATSDGSIYVAHDAGEFGGGLEWIHVCGPGHRTTQEEVFGGPTTGALVDPTDRRCVIASQGLVHGDSSGRVVRSCPGDLSVLLQVGERPCEPECQTGALDKRRQMVPFFKVVANGSTVYAVGQDETYAITGHAARRLPPPTFAEHCGLPVAHVEGLTFIRDPVMAKRFRRDVIDLSRFAAPAL